MSAVSGGVPKIAVYLVTYRRHEMLRRAIASVLSQSHENLVLYVVNDDPDDAFARRVRNFPYIERLD